MLLSKTVSVFRFLPLKSDADSELCVGATAAILFLTIP